MKYFSIAELCKSQTANDNGINNTPSKEIESNLTILIGFLDELREQWGSPIRVNSGYRCEALNKAVKGSATSAHMLGFAADLWPLNGKFEDFKIFCLDFIANKEYDQCIIEKNSSGSQWIHIGLYNNKMEQRKSHFSLSVK